MKSLEIQLPSDPVLPVHSLSCFGFGGGGFSPGAIFSPGGSGSLLSPLTLTQPLVSSISLEGYEQVSVYPIDKDNQHSTKFGISPKGLVTSPTLHSAFATSLKLALVTV